MASEQKPRTSFAHNPELGESISEYEEVEDCESKSEAARELLQRGLDDWSRERATYPGSEFVETAIQISAVGFVVGVVVAVITSSGLALRQTATLAGVVVLFLGIHYAALLADGQPSQEADDVRETGGR